jgi:ComF family protein
VAEFEAVSREAVHALKYGNRHAISGLMGRLMGRAAMHLGADVVVHVALHTSRRRERGYDQAAFLARHIARDLDIPFQKDALARTRKTRQQVTLGPQERRRNVEGAFRVTRPVQGRHVLLVDDVYTTGSTLEAAAAVLMESGSECVTGLVFARARAGVDGRHR